MFKMKENILKCADAMHLRTSTRLIFMDLLQIKLYSFMNLQEKLSLNISISVITQSEIMVQTF